MTFPQFVRRARLLRHEYPQLRLGQAYFNALYQYRPDLSERVRATKLDPFNCDERIPEFLAFIEANWYEESGIPEAPCQDA